MTNFLFFLLKSCFKLLSLLPLKLRSSLGKCLGFFLYLIKIRSKIVSANINYCFERLTPVEKKALLKDHFINFGEGLFNSLTLWSNYKKFKKNNCKFTGLNHYLTAVKSNKPILLLGHHSVYLEESIACLSQKLDFHFFYRPNDNNSIEQFIQRSRESFYPCIPRLPNIQGGNYNRLVSHLNNNKNLLLLTDQDFGSVGTLFAPFYGKPMATLKTPVLLANTTGAIVLPIGYYKTHNTINIEVFPPLTFTHDDLGNCTIINKALEASINKAPEQYYWLHRRFKTLPDGHDSIY